MIARLLRRRNGGLRPHFLRLPAAPFGAIAPTRRLRRARSLRLRRRTAAAPTCGGMAANKGGCRPLAPASRRPQPRRLAAARLLIYIFFYLQEELRSSFHLHLLAKSVCFNQAFVPEN